MPVQVRLPALVFIWNPHFQLGAEVDSFSLLNIPIIALAEEIFLLKSIMAGRFTLINSSLVLRSGKFLFVNMTM